MHRWTYRSLWLGDPFERGLGRRYKRLAQHTDADVRHLIEVWTDHPTIKLGSIEEGLVVIWRPNEILIVMDRFDV